MNDNSTVLLAALGIVSACVAGLLWVIKFMFKELLPTIQGLEHATKANTSATKSADKYLKERNGRDTKIHTELVTAIKEIPAQIVETASITAKELKKHEN